MNNIIKIYAAALGLIFSSSPAKGTEVNVSPVATASPAATNIPSPTPTPVTTGDPSSTVEEAVKGLKPLWEAITKKPLLIVGALILLLLAGLIIILLIRRRKSEQAKKETGENPMYKAPPGSILIGNVQNIGKRDSQQDCFGISDLSNKALLSEKGILAVVADGMGGLANGAEVSALVTRSLLGQFSTRPSSDEAQELLTMLTNTNREVNSFLKDIKDKSGSTLVAVIIKDLKLHWISVGDSRIYLVRNGALIQINREHTYSSELDERAAMGEISWEKAKGDPQRNALTSYIGMGDLEKIDRSLRALQLVPGDRILLMSDGVFGTLSEEEILSTMNFIPYEAAAELEKLIISRNRKGQDNFTAIIIECY